MILGRFFLLSSALACGLAVFANRAQADLWCTAYYPGWEQTSMPASNIDFTVLTHLIHFSLVPNSNGTLDSNANSLSAANSSDAVSRAHSAGRKVLICVGGANSQTGFQGATSPANLPSFIGNLTNFMAARGYDGLDLDWEPLTAADTQQYTNLVNGLRSALNGFPQHKLLTAAVGAYPPYGDPPLAQYTMFAALQSQFDQLNIMTYDLSGPWGGWVTWFNSPIYDGGLRFPSSGGLVPSINGSVSNFLTNGMAAAKLGIGVAFYGYVWSGGSGTSTGGVTQPRQSWTTAPTVTTPSFTAIMATYYQSNLYHWDTAAQAAYLSVSNANPANDMFISYDDQHTCLAKLSYARNLHLGGVMLWELALDHQNGQPDPLLQAIKQGLETPGLTSIQLQSQNVTLSFDALPLGSYSVQWTSDLTAHAWNTLWTTNAGSAGPLQVTDPNPPSQPKRFYRVQSPP